MDTFVLKLNYKNDSKQYYKNIFPWLTDKQIQKYLAPNNDTNEYQVNGIIFNNNSKYYLLTPIILNQFGYDYFCVYDTKKISCKVLSISYEYYMQLFELENCKIEYSIPIDKIETIIPDVTEKIEINKKLFQFKKILKPIPTGFPISNLVYAINETIEKGLPVYQNNLFVGMTINKYESINIFSILHFINDSINNKYNGIKTVFFQTNKKSQIITTFNIQSNLQINDILLEINKIPIIDNNIEHPIFGIIPVSTLILLLQTDSVKFKINRDDKKLELTIPTQHIHNHELISSNLNKPVNYKKIDNKIYYELNLAIMRCYMELNRFGMDKNLHDIYTDCNINSTHELDTKMVFKFDRKKLKNKCLSLQDHIEIINDKHIKNINYII
jgi:hypothetical protein